MANNRLYIKCKNCGAATAFTKNFGKPFVLDDMGVQKINSFFEDHAYCGNGKELAHGGDFVFYDEWSDEDD